MVTFLVFWRRQPPKRASVAFACVGTLVSLVLTGYWIIQFAGALQRQL
jgi:hypothetical protein